MYVGVLLEVEIKTGTIHKNTFPHPSDVIKRRCKSSLAVDISIYLICTALRMKYIDKKLPPAETSDDK